MSPEISQLISFFACASGAALIGFMIGIKIGRYNGWCDVIEDKVRYYENAGFLHVDDQMGGQW